MKNGNVSISIRPVSSSFFLPYPKTAPGRKNDLGQTTFDAGLLHELFLFKFAEGISIITVLRGVFQGAGFIPRGAVRFKVRFEYTAKELTLTKRRGWPVSRNASMRLRVGSSSS